MCLQMPSQWLFSSCTCKCQRGNLGFDNLSGQYGGFPCCVLWYLSWNRFSCVEQSSNQTNNKTIKVLAIYKISKVVPASAGGQRGGGDVADGGGLQGRGGHARAHEEHLWFAVDLFGGPLNMLMSAKYIKQSHQQVLIIWQCKTKRHSHYHKKKKT